MAKRNLASIRDTLLETGSWTDEWRYYQCNSLNFKLNRLDDSNLKQLELPMPVRSAHSESKFADLESSRARAT